MRATWKSEPGGSEEDNQPQAPPDSLDDISPVVSVAFEELEQLMFEDKAGTPILTPSGESFGSPVFERVPLRVRTIKQYEASTVTDDVLQERALRVNSDEYQDKEAWGWLVRDIRVNDVKLRLATGKVDAREVTYTLAYNPSVNPEDNSFLGWRQAIALVDTHYDNDPPNEDWKPFVDAETKTIELGRVTTSGEKVTDGEFDYLVLETFDTTDFSFLKA